MKIKVEVFGPLTEFFDSSFLFEVGKGDTVDDLIMELVNTEVIAKELLVASAIALDDEIIDKDYELKENDNITLLPPPSGG